MKPKLTAGIMLTIAVVLSVDGFAQERPETGQVKWNRDLAAAKKLSAQTQKPILLLFQEIPG